MTEKSNNHVLLAAGVYASFFCFSNLTFAADYTRPLAEIAVEDKLHFRIGKSVFEKFWVASPSSTTASDGLGPLYNARSCHSCHLNNGRGHAPKAAISGASVPSFMVRLGKTYPLTDNVSNTLTKDAPHTIYPHIGDKTYGHQFQGNSTPGILPEGDFTVSYQTHIETLADGTQVTLRKPLLHWTKLNYGQFEDHTGFTMLMAPALIGMGLLDQVPEAFILANADPDDSNKDGIRGRPSWLPATPGQARRLGRFGYKASVATLSEQNQLAFNTDLGLSTPLQPSPTGDCTDVQIDCIQSPNGNSAHLDNLEVDKKQMALLDAFVALSSPPAMRNLSHSDFSSGKQVFEELGCASCHTPKMQTGNTSTFAALNNRTFYPFTDLLLHDMGPGLASGFPSFSAKPMEWRTAPLWGMGLSKKVSGREGFLHDGRAKTLEEAILWHGGEALNSQQNYKNLSAEQRRTLMFFLESL